MKNNKFQYIFFDTGACKNGKPDTDNYYFICTEDLRTLDSVSVVAYPMDYLPVLAHKIYLLLQYVAKTFRISVLNKLCFPFYFNSNIVDASKHLCFIVYGYYIQPDYLRYLKLKYPNCKIVKIHRDSYDIWRRKNKEFTDSDMSSLFDLQMSYDNGDSKKYGMIHFDEIESKTSVIVDKNYPLYDVFFAGAAKDRLPLLLSIYDHLSKNGFKCFFYLTCVDKKNQIKRDNIVYADKNMSYREMLHHTVNSKVVLEVNQGCVDGFTSRFLESVLYNKRLLTNNIAVKKNRYYSNRFICCFVKPDEISPDFINDNTEVNYNYAGEFSPVHLIRLIENSLK